LPSTIRTLLDSVRKNKLLVDKEEDKNDIRNSKGYLRCRSPYLGTQDSIKA